MDRNICLYCGKPIDEEPRVCGANRDAHQECVRARLVERAGPHWIEKHCTKPAEEEPPW